MVIRELQLTNFKRFEQESYLLHPECTLIVGINGAGKTSILEAMSVAVGSWFLGIDGAATRHIRQSEVRLAPKRWGEADDRVTTWETQYPCRVAAIGEFHFGEAPLHLNWERALNGTQGRTTYGDATDLKRLATEVAEHIRTSEYEVELPLVAYYGSGRLWDVPRAAAKVREKRFLLTEALKSSRLDGYENSLDPRISVSALSSWIARQSWIGFQRGRETQLFKTVKAAILRCVDRAQDLYFDADYGEVILEIEGQGAQPFNNLSDGQRSILALVGDLAHKAATLNPHLGDEALRETPGVVLIDELDLHLHPKWQRHILEELRTTFPRLQFVATTHSPFLIQSLRVREELILLGGQPPAEPPSLSLSEIAYGIMGIERPDTSERYNEMRSVARHYLESLKEAKLEPPARLEQFKEQLASEIAPYADNPAYQAFLEMNRAAALGE